LTKLLDTNVVSEIMRPRPDPKVMGWLGALEYDAVHISVITISEIRLGVERLAPGVRKSRLNHWLTHELPTDFEGRMHSVTEAVADRCGQIRARAFDVGRPMDAMDAFLAATADVHGLTLVTRNVRDFEVWGGPILNPWSD
jgi:predicted nucleic acid-binding protein